MKKIRNQLTVFFLVILTCFVCTQTRVDAYSKAKTKKILTIALPKSPDKNVKKAITKFNKDANVPYQIRLVTVSSAKIKVSSFDGLIVPGGKHVHPSFYHSKTICKKHIYDKKLDQFEIDLVKKFKKAKKPILGICRGAQLVNVVLGGTLKTDIGYSHYKWACRTTKTVSKTAMRKLFGTSFETLHSHHQAVKKLAKDLKVTMKDADGTIEGYQHKSLPIIGVQFHPEVMYTKKVSRKTEESGKKYLLYFFDLCSKS